MPISYPHPPSRLLKNSLSRGKRAVGEGSGELRSTEGGG